MNERQEKELKRRLYRSERNAQGNCTANELYTRLEYHNPWITDPRWSSEMTLIKKILEFLEQFSVGDVRMLDLSTCEIQFDEPLSTQEIKDMEIELKASFFPDERQGYLGVAVFDLRDYTGNDYSGGRFLPMTPNKKSYEERVKELREKQKEEMVSHAEKERLRLQELKQAEARTTSKLNPRETIARIADEHGFDVTNYDTARMLFYYVVKDLIAPDLRPPKTPISDDFIKRLEDLSKIKFNHFLDLSGAG